MMGRLRYAAACVRVVEAAKAFVFAVVEMAEAARECGDQGEGDAVADAVQQVFTGAATSLPGFADVFPRRPE